VSVSKFIEINYF